MRRVLVVDDDELTREIAQLSLELAGWTVLTAASGPEALERAATERPEAVLMDVMMPGMDGPTACRLLAADPATAAIPVILFTAKSRPVATDEWPGLDLAGVLSKPFDPVRLARDVRDLLGWSD